jgi:hypothetical protein
MKRNTTPESSYTVWSLGDLVLKLTHVHRRNSVVLSLYHGGQLVCSGEVEIGQLVVGAHLPLVELKECVRAHAQLNGIRLPKGWLQPNGRERDPEDFDSVAVA